MPCFGFAAELSAGLDRDDARRRLSRPGPGRDQSEEGSPIVFSIETLIIAFILLAVVVYVGASVRILREYERAVVFTLGRFQKVKGPGLVL